MADSPSSRKSPLRFLLWIPVVLCVLYLTPALLTWWPPNFIERHTQRQKLAERVQAAGGWDAVRRDCVALAAQNTNGLYSHWGDTNLPQTIRALKPFTVEYHPPYGRVSMRVFGMHSTGGHSTPYFGLEIVTDKRADYRPGGGQGGGVIGNRHTTFRQIADGVYEIY